MGLRVIRDTQMQPGSEITIETADGSLVTGRIAEPQTDKHPSVVGNAEGSVDTSDAMPDRVDAAGDTTETGPTYGEVRVPAGTMLAVTLETVLASHVSRAEDPVRGQLARAVSVDGAQVIPAGSIVEGTVVAAEAAGKVKGRASLAFRFPIRSRWTAYATTSILT